MDIFEAIKGSYGILSIVAEKMKLPAYETKNLIEKTKGADKAFLAESAAIRDLAKMKLYEAINAGEPWAIKYVAEGGKV